MGHCCFPSPLNREREFWLMPDGIYASRIYNAQPNAKVIWKWPGFADLACRGTLLQTTKGDPQIPHDAFHPVGDIFPLIRMTWRLPDGSLQITTHSESGSCIAASPKVVPQYPVWQPPAEVAVTVKMEFKVEDVSDEEGMPDRGSEVGYRGAAPWIAPLADDALDSPASPDPPDSSLSPTSPLQCVPPVIPPASPAYEMLMEALSDLAPQPLLGRLLISGDLPGEPSDSP